MAEDKKCMSCGCECTGEDAVTDSQEESQTNIHDAQFAVLLALVPAMTMSLFNMMGII